MSKLGALLESQRDVLLAKWTERIGKDAPSKTLPELASHIPSLLVELREALIDGRAPESSVSAADHGERGQKAGFDVEAVVREYRHLFNTILDSAEAEGLALTMLEFRIVQDFVSRAVAQGVGAHRRYEQGIQRTLDGELRAQEGELRLVVDAMPSLVSFVTADERYGLVNKTYEQWFGASRESMRGRTVAEVVGAEAYAQLSSHVKRALAGETFSIEAYGVKYPSGVRDVSIAFVPRRSAAGVVEGYVVVVDDISARRSLEAERGRLLESERAARRAGEQQRKHLETLVATAPIGIATWRGPTHIFESANDRYLAALQKPGTILGQPFASAFSELLPDHPLFAIYDRVYRTGTPFVEPEYRITLDLDGRPQPKTYVFHLTPVRDADGRIDGVMACILDVTDVVALREVVEVERDLATAVAALEGKSRDAAEEARAQTEFLLRVAGALNESLELGVVLQRLVDIIAPDHAVIASVWGALSGKPLERIVHAPFRAELAEAPVGSALAAGGPLAIPIGRVLETGETIYVDDYRARMVAEGAPEVGKSLGELGVGPVLLVPIRRGRDAVAVLALARAPRGRFSEEDVVVFESVARLAALAFENARLFGEMARLRRNAEDATEAKDRFLAHVSHDLRNPLNSILGWSTLLRGMKNDPAQFLRGIDVIERNAKSQVQLIEDLLDVSRITSGKLSLEIAVEDVRAAIDTGLDSARLAASAKNIEIVVSVEADIGAIAVDRDRFRQIVWNLVSNAVKFTPTGGTVNVNAQRLASTFQLVVSDTGRGISPEFLPRVFASFEQAEAGARRSGGLGLGLAIVRHLVELHGGSIRAESEGEGKGSRFTVELPIRAAVHSLEVGSTSNAPRALDGARILVVDDEEDAREVVKAILERAGAAVTIAGSADEAIASVLRAPPELVVSDIGMPAKDGKAFVRELRTFDESKGGRIPAVALTALVRVRDRVEILAAGFNAHVAKPIEPAELVLLAAGLLGRPLPEVSGI